MKSFKFLCVAAAVLAMAACDNNEVENPDEEYESEEYYAGLASISSNDSNYTATSDGATVKVSTEGGEVTVSVDCGAEWIADNHAKDMLDLTVDSGSGSVTMSIGQNTVEEERTGTVIFATATSYLVFATVTVVQPAYNAPEISVGTTSWNAPAVGALTTSISVDASTDWNVESVSAEWLSAVKTDEGTLTLTAAENEETEERDAEVVITGNDGVRAVSTTIEVNQDARAYITLSSEALDLAEEEFSTEVTVKSNYDWDFSYDNDLEWITIARQGDALLVSVEENYTGVDRETIVTLTASDGAENVAEVQLPISQIGVDISDMVFVYETPAVNTQIQLPLYGTVDCTVDWGDGSSEEITSTLPYHTYASAGQHEVRVNGTVTALYSKSITLIMKNYLKQVKQWGTTGLTDMNYGLYYCQYMTSIPAKTRGALADVTSFDHCFYYNTYLESIPADLFEGCDKVTTFYHVFYQCKAVESLPAGLFDDCASVTTFADAFEQCTSLTTIPANLFAHCTDVTTFQKVFYGCTALTDLPEGIFAGCKAATNFEYAFQQCVALKTLPSDLFSECTAANSFKYVFDQCTGLETIPGSLFANCPDVTSFYYAFYKCSSLTAIPEGLLDACTAATDFRYIFDGCSTITSIPESLFAKCTAAKQLEYIFTDCTSLTSIPSKLFANNPSVTTFSRAFCGCTGIESIPSDLFANNAAATTMSDCFESCTSLKSIPDTLFYPLVSAKLFSNIFYKCSSLKSIPKGLFSKNTAATSFTYAFAYCTALTEIPEGLFSACADANVFSYLFQNCTGLTSLPSDLFENNLQITNFSYAFNGCTALKGESPYNVVDGEKIHIYERTAADGFKAPTLYTKCFTSCTGLSDYYDIPSKWGGGGE